MSCDAQTVDLMRVALRQVLATSSGTDIWLYVSSLMVLSNMWRYMMWSKVATGSFGSNSQSHAVKGTLLPNCWWFEVICGASLYSLSNVQEEILLKRHCSRSEALGMLGLFGSSSVLMSHRPGQLRIPWNLRGLRHHLLRPSICPWRTRPSHHRVVSAPWFCVAQLLPNHGDWEMGLKWVKHGQ